MTNLSPDILSGLIRSVGTHRGNRVYSPIEVAELFKASLDAGFSRSELGQKVLLNPSMIGRFLRLLDLPDEIGSLIDWNGTGAPIVMSTASEIARLKNPEDQKTLAYGVLEHRMTKPETQEVLQLVSSGAAELPDAILRTVNGRPKFDNTSVFVGAVTEPRLLVSLASFSQSERDRSLSNVLSRLLPSSVEFTSKLGKTKFIVTGKDELQDRFRRLPDGFESELNRLLTLEIVG